MTIVQNAGRRGGTRRRDVRNLLSFGEVFGKEKKECQTWNERKR